MPVDFINSRWYAIRTASRSEKIVRDQLAHRGVETLLPLRTRASQWKDRTKLIEVALFPEYCLARFSQTQRQSVLQTPGVVEVVGSRDELEPIIAEEIAVLQLLVQSSIPYKAHPCMEEGTTVEVIQGPLLGTRGTCLKQDLKNRLILSVSLIRKAVAVEMEANNIKAVADDQSED